MIFVWNVSALFESSVLERYIPFLDASRQEQIERLKSFEDKARCAGAGILLAEGYRQFHERKDRELAVADSLLVLKKEDLVWIDDCFCPAKKEKLPTIKTGEQGKPFFELETEPFFSLSHAGDFVACYIGKRDMAIDLECVRPRRDAVMKRVFSKEENQAIENLLLLHQEEEANRLFIQLWTQKEDMSKLDGHGIAFLYHGDLEEKTRQMSTQSIWINQMAVLTVAYWNQVKE